METSHVFSNLIEALADPTVRTIVLKGGARSTKTFSSLQACSYAAIRSKRSRLISVVSETMPHLRRGCIRDFRSINEGEGFIFAPPFWNETDKIARFGRGTVEFFSADSPARVLGPARDWLFINECINLSYDTFRQLAVRTREKIILDYNPAWEFWVDSKVIPQPDTRLIISTYKDNDFLSAAQVRDIEAQRELDPEWWRVYGLGETGTLEGLVIDRWDIVAAMPKDFKREWVGVDFGFGAPTAIVHVGISAGEVYHDQVAYDTNLTNPDIAECIKSAGLGHLLIIADSAEPKSIQELRNAGLTVEPADKGPDSVRIGIQIMNRQKKHYTARSLSLIDELRKYHYAKDRDGEFDKTHPVDKFNHGIDAARYVYLNYLGETRSGYAITY